MTGSQQRDIWRYTPAAMCRMDQDFLVAVTNPEEESRICVSAGVLTLIGTVAYGLTFGIWRDPLQGIYSAMKMPLLFFSAVLSTCLINTMLALLVGATLSFKKVCMTVLLGMAITAILLAAVSPVVLFLVLQLPPPAPSAPYLPPDHSLVTRSMRVYWAVLLGHVAVIATCGIIGNVRLYRLLRLLTGTRPMAVRLMIIWIAVIGFTGCQLSWLFSPFLCKPTQLPHILPQEYFQQNFYERIWFAINEVIKKGT